MYVEYNHHALKRMRERKVTEHEVEDTLRNYETELPGQWGRSNRYKVVNGRRIRVTFDQEDQGKYYVWTVTADEVQK